MLHCKKKSGIFKRYVKLTFANDQAKTFMEHSKEATLFKMSNNFFFFLRKFSSFFFLCVYSVRLSFRFNFISFATDGSTKISGPGSTNRSNSKSRSSIYSFKGIIKRIILNAEKDISYGYAINNTF